MQAAIGIIGRDCHSRFYIQRWVAPGLNVKCLGCDPDWVIRHQAAPSERQGRALEQDAVLQRKPNILLRDVSSRSVLSRDVRLEQADIGDSAAARSLIARTVSEFGRIDVLINKAATIVDKPALEMTELDWDHVFAVNLKGAFFCAQQAAQQMLTQDNGGTIINIGASTGLRGRRNGVNTCASKAGLMMMTQCLALELAPRIRVNTVIPGLVVTEETTHRFNLDDPASRQTRLDTVPMARLGRPEDVASAIMILLSPDSGFITGQKLVVDGGQNMW